MEFSARGSSFFAYTGGRAPVSGQPAIVFIHGAAHDHGVWGLQSRYFASHGWNVYALDLPGHGRSAGDPLDSIESLADWLIAALDAMGIERATLVGHSMGSLIALEAAGRFRPRVGRIALVGSTVPMGVSDGLLAAARDNVRAAITMITQWSHGPSTLAGTSPLPGLWLPGINAALMARARPGVLHRDLLNCRNYANGLVAAAAVACPAVVLAGSRDLMTPAKSLEPLRSALPAARLVMIDGAGHAMLSERPDAVLDALRDFARVPESER
jgi:pimeloyl-ACP methyl ester carboxylesterase